jgi:hypothetical protein
MNTIKGKLAEKLTESAIDYTKETVKEVIEEDSINKGHSQAPSISVNYDKDLKSATQEIVDTTKEYVEKNKENVVVVSKKFTDVASKFVNKTKEKVIDAFKQNKSDEIKDTRLRNEGKVIIIDATNGKTENEGTESVLDNTGENDNNNIHLNLQKVLNLGFDNERERREINSGLIGNILGWCKPKK